MITFAPMPEEDFAALELFQERARNLGVEWVELQIFTHKEEDVLL